MYQLNQRGGGGLVRASMGKYGRFYRAFNANGIVPLNH